MRQNNNLLTYIFICMLILYASIDNLYAQVTIGALEKPNACALMDIKENDKGESTKGMLLPRVKLNICTDPSPMTSHVEGLIVYNTTANDHVSPGLYKNDGHKWNIMQIPDGGKQGQFLIVDRKTLSPRWSTVIIPTPQEEDYSLIETKAYSTRDGAEIKDDSGAGMYTENSRKDTKWKTITNFPVSVKNKSNRVIIFMQTTLLQETSKYSGWTSYAGGIFINGQLKGVRVGTLVTTGQDTELSKSETLYFVLENMPVGTNNIEIAFARRNSTTDDGRGTKQAMLHIGKPMYSNSVDQIGSTSLSYQYYEKYNLLSNK